MSKKPKPPIGFVPVDSEEARGIAPTQWVNQAFISKGKWVYSYGLMNSAREAHKDMRYHVQLPPPVEWEEVWGWYQQHDTKCYMLTKKGKDMGTYFEHDLFNQDHLNTIVRALNEMEES